MICIKNYVRKLHHFLLWLDASPLSGRCRESLSLRGRRHCHSGATWHEALCGWSQARRWKPRLSCVCCRCRRAAVSAAVLALRRDATPRTLRHVASLGQTDGNDCCTIQSSAFWQQRTCMQLISQQPRMTKLLLYFSPALRIQMLAQTSLHANVIFNNNYLV